MPKDLSIAVFVLGAVLLLISLVSGGFKIFGAEVSGSAGKVGRTLAFVIGLVLIVVGINFKNGTNAESIPNSRPEPTSLRPPAEAQSLAPAQAAPVTTVPPALPVAGAQLNVRWNVAPEEHLALWASLSEAERAQVQLLLLAGADVFAARIQISNTGAVPVNVFPDKLRFSIGGQQLPGSTYTRPRFLQQTTVAAGQSTEGLMIFVAPTLSVAQVMLSYEDPTIRVSYAR